MQYRENDKLSVLLHFLEKQELYCAIEDRFFLVVSRQHL